MIPISDDNPVRITPWVTWLLIFICCIVYLWEFTLGDAMDDVIGQIAFTPASGVTPHGVPILATAPLEAIVVSMFLHGGLVHLGGNMLYLWIFGNNIEDAMGHARYALFYLMCGFAAAFTMAFMDPASQIPVVGASGAISGALAAYVLLYPRARINVIVPLGIIFYPFKLGAVWVVGFWFILQLAMAALADPTQPGTAWWAHVGGFAAGLVLTPLLKSRYVALFGPGPALALIQPLARPVLSTIPKTARAFRTGTGRAWERVRAMKHKNSHLMVGYWSRIRRGRAIPDQTDIDPRAVKRMLPYVFILDAADFDRPLYRLAGTSLCERYGRELRATNFLAHWEAQSRGAISALLRQALKLKQPICISSIAATADCGMVELETVLAPVSFGPGEPTRFVGLVQILSDATPLVGRTIAFERLVASSLVREDEPLTAFDAAPPPPPPPADMLRSHPRAPYLRLVINRDRPATLHFDASTALQKLFDVFGGVPDGEFAV